MKRLLTFIYGLLNLSIGFYFESQFNLTIEWYKWLYFVGIIVMVISGLEKLDKATR